MQTDTGTTLSIGWSSADLTPQQPVIIAGQFHARVSEGVKDPVTATALALESTAPGGDAACGRVILATCDLASIPDSLRDGVRERVKTRLPGLDPCCVCLSATHTHAAPEVRIMDDHLRHGISGAPSRFGLSPDELGVMSPVEYADFAADRIADAVVAAWESRQPGGIAFGVGQAVVGRNRRITYSNGESRMYGRSDTPEFNHIEGDSDPDLNLLCTVDCDRNLTGIVVNLACPAQVSEHIYQISADFWHDTREALRSRLGESLFVLPQCSAAGDQSPHVLIKRAAEARMLALKGWTPLRRDIQDNNLGAPDALRREIACRIAHGIDAVLPHIMQAVEWNPRLAHHVETVELTRSRPALEDVENARVEAAELEAQYEALLADLKARPAGERTGHWYHDVTRAFHRMQWNRGVQVRCRLSREQPRVPTEVTVVRLGDLAIATNPFELFLDYGMRIKARAPGLQTFVVQLTGTGTYVPTERAVAGKSYGATPASNPVGPEGGQELVEQTLDMLQSLWR